ncbi:MAG: sigma-70 family RNA polymerase sigma factor, partial [Firmicutes bacterium]|nr:sigma-70 family RNA polymerase sigma factor [Bacillota bacterium]
SDMIGPDDRVIGKEDMSRLRNAVMGLEEPSKEIMLRRFFVGQKPAEISAAMDMPVRKVENLIYRSKEKLRNDLEG